MTEHCDLLIGGQSGSVGRDNHGSALYGLPVGKVVQLYEAMMTRHSIIIDEQNGLGIREDDNSALCGVDRWLQRFSYTRR